MIIYIITIEVCIDLFTEAAKRVDAEYPHEQQQKQPQQQQQQQQQPQQPGAAAPPTRSERRKQQRAAKRAEEAATPDAAAPAQATPASVPRGTLEPPDKSLAHPNKHASPDESAAWVQAGRCSNCGESHHQKVCPYNRRDGKGWYAPHVPVAPNPSPLPAVPAQPRPKGPAAPLAAPALLQEPEEGDDDLPHPGDQPVPQPAEMTERQRGNFAALVTKTQPPPGAGGLGVGSDSSDPDPGPPTSPWGGVLFVCLCVMGALAWPWMVVQAYTAAGAFEYAPVMAVVAVSLIGHAVSPRWWRRRWKLHLVASSAVLCTAVVCPALLGSAISARAGPGYHHSRRHGSRGRLSHKLHRKGAC